jgi:hypothetical protein
MWRKGLARDMTILSFSFSLDPRFLLLQPPPRGFFFGFGLGFG